ncbi:MAG TPA: hypothetical protein PK990_03725 [Salinivirgaceae bacterium]|nr:hypothetical protein [Salinivirgaceae bacterium]
MRIGRHLCLIFGIILSLNLEAQDLNQYLQRGFDFQIKNQYREAINLYDSLRYCPKKCVK